MKTRTRIVRLMLGGLSSMVCIMGCYPLVPGVFAANCLMPGNIWLVWILTALGMGYFMPFATTVKYLIILFVIWMGIRFAFWANKRCASILAAVIAGIVTFVISAMGTAASDRGWTSWTLNACEGIMVCGVTLTVNIGLVMLDQMKHLKRRSSKRPVVKHASMRAEAFSEAMGELSATFADTGQGAVKSPGDYRIAEMRMVMAGQLDAVADIVQEWSVLPSNLDGKYKGALLKLVYEAKERGLQLEEAHAYEQNGHLQVIASVQARYSGAASAREYCRALEKAFGRPMRLHKETRGIIGEEAVSITAYEDTAFYTLFGMALQKKQGSVISGDSFSIFETEDGCCHICLSDGTGTGKQASKESGLVVELMEKLLQAGFKKESAIKLLNSAMVVQENKDSYSTLDYARLDLYGGWIELTKIGAAASFLKKGKEVDVILSENPPTGADTQLEVAPVEKAVEEGDFLVMVTDGVIEYLQEEQPEAYLAELIRSIQTDNANVFAKTILEQILQKTGGYAMDDMTILVIGIWSK